MVRKSFLNPHLDNSHDARQTHYRVLNSLYYMTPDWREEYGGNLELWDRGVGQPQRTIVSKFNRLVLMETTRTSWHSVSPVGARRTPHMRFELLFSRAAGRERGLLSTVRRSAVVPRRRRATSSFERTTRFGPRSCRS
jgi:hypothetical protein